MPGILKIAYKLLVNDRSKFSALRFLHIHVPPSEAEGGA